MSEDASSSDNPHVPSFFPLVRKGCEEVSTEFFSCLEEGAVPGEKKAALEALERCKDKLKAYEKCFESSMSKRNAPPAPVLTRWGQELGS